MTPKEKANELYNEMLQWQDSADIYIERNIISISAKHSALIAVDKLIDYSIGTDLDFFRQVKQEIEKL